MPLWKDIEAKAAKLGVTVEQGLSSSGVTVKPAISRCSSRTGEVAKGRALLWSWPILSYHGHIKGLQHAI